MQLYRKQKKPSLILKATVIASKTQSFTGSFKYQKCSCLSVSEFAQKSVNERDKSIQLGGRQPLSHLLLIRLQIFEQMRDGRQATNAAGFVSYSNAQALI